MIAWTALSDSATVRQLPAIVPGYHADVLSLAVHPKVNCTVRLGHYVPYSQLMPAARTVVSPQDNDSLVIALTADRSLNHTGKRSISVADWMAAGKMVVKLVCTYHGEERAQALEAHHCTVTRLAALTDWHAVFLYDTQEQEMAVAEPQHDLGMRNETRLELQLQAGAFAVAQTATSRAPVRRPLPVATAPAAQTTMAAASVAQRPTVQASAPWPDPRRVVTPLDPDALEQMLNNANILPQWSHIIRGIQEGFDVGITEPITKMVICNNHSSFQLDPTFIDMYIAEEQAAG
ncbi:hypothetical protein C8Q73DRAFT_661559 [Cubamyces lactineus]|nr:hypothetical protein C8Q73DRAFT_661559 [Cubamyces lactineus]